MGREEQDSNKGDIGTDCGLVPIGDKRDIGILDICCGNTILDGDRSDGLEGSGNGYEEGELAHFPLSTTT